MEQCPNCARQLKTKAGLYGHRRLLHGQQRPYSKVALAKLGEEVVATREAFAGLLKEKPELAVLARESQMFLENVIVLLSQGVKLEVKVVES